MNRVEIKEKIEELINTIDSASTELSEITRDFERYEDCCCENEDINSLQDELNILNDKINNSIYRSDEFYSLKEKIQEKESELSELKENLLSEENDADNEMENLLCDVEEVGSKIWDIQNDLYQTISD